jgi:CubicO group peptidase (beta-lactamase class C family)
MKKILLQLFLTLLLFIPACIDPATKPGTTTPESLGISSRAILEFINAAENERKEEFHSFVLLRHGKIAAQGWWNPYNPESPHMLFSLSKSFTSTAIGIAQSEGLLNINDKVISLLLMNPACSKFSPSP